MLNKFYPVVCIYISNNKNVTVNQDLFTFQDHMLSPLDFCCVPVAQSRVFYFVFCKQLLVLRSFLNYVMGLSVCFPLEFEYPIDIFHLFHIVLVKIYMIKSFNQKDISQTFYNFVKYIM